MSHRLRVWLPLVPLKGRLQLHQTQAVSVVTLKETAHPMASQDMRKSSPIASRLEAITHRSEAIAKRLEAIAISHRY